MNLNIHFYAIHELDEDYVILEEMEPNF